MSATMTNTINTITHAVRLISEVHAVEAECRTILDRADKGTAGWVADLVEVRDRARGLAGRIEALRLDLGGER
jgi:hypothetical protein